MRAFLSLWGKRTIEVLLFTAVLWGIFVHSAFWAISSFVLFSLLAVAFCVWAGGRLFCRESSLDLSRRARYARSMPSLSFQSPLVWVPIILLNLFVIFQTIPLPVSFVEFLSPKRVELARQISEAVPDLDTGFLTLSVDPNATRRLLPFMLVPLFAFILGNVLAASRRSARRVIFFLIIVALVEALYGLLEQASGHHYVLWIATGDSDAQGSFLNRNHFAAFLSLFLPVTVGWFYFRASDVYSDSDRDNLLPPTSWDVLNSRQGLWILAPAILIMGIIQSHSRGGFSSMIFGLALMFGAGWRDRLARTFSALAVILAFIVFAYAISSDYEMVLNRFDNMAEMQGDGRIEIWRNSAAILDDYPLCGIGPGNFADFYRQHEESSNGHSPWRAHNDWLEGFIVFGYPGMGLFIIALFVCFVRGFRVIRYAHTDKPWLLGVWCGLVGLVLHSFVEFNFQALGITIVAPLLLGLLLGFERHTPLQQDE